MGRRGFCWKRVGRYVLTLLCLLASFAYLTRQTETSVLNAMSGMSAEQMADMPGMKQVAQIEAPAGSSGEHHHLTSADQQVPSAHMDLTTSAPNAPPAPADHNHAGHCPFCFTAAFALTAEGATLSVTFVKTAVEADILYVRPLLMALYHADPRAPPKHT